MKAVLLPAFGQGRLVPVFRLPCRNAPDRQKTDKHPTLMQQAASSGQHGKIKQKKKPARTSRSHSYSDAAKTYSAATTITLMSAKTPL